MDQAPQYAIDHVANSPKNLFEFEALDSLSQKISSFFGINSDSLFYIDLGITKHVFYYFLFH
jgi:F-type H+-transporting ATPase subunit a